MNENYDDSHHRKTARTFIYTKSKKIAKRFLYTKKAIHLTLWDFYEIFEVRIYIQNA